jgi:molecular chaperone GrpE
MTRETKDGFVVNDRRFWANEAEHELPEASADETPPPAEPAPPPAAPAVDTEALRSALADLEETKYRVRRDAEKQLDLQRGRILEALLPVLDNLERSIQAGQVGGKTGNLEALLEGVKLVHQQFLAALGNFGLERRSAVGARFDPNLHDAVAVVPVTDAAQDGVVVHEIEPAYLAGERVIRAARVVVGRAAERPAS